MSLQRELAPDPRAFRGFDEIWPFGSVDGVDALRGHQGYAVFMYTCETLRLQIFGGIFGAILGLTVAAGLAQATDIYKSIDANGKVVYSDHLDASMSQSTAVQLDDPMSPPRELHFCWTNCFTLVLDDGVYRRIDGTDESWTVEAFSAKGIVLHRHDAPAEWNGYSQDVVYAGRVSNGRLIGVTVNGIPVSGIDASWGSALTTLPDSNAERDAGNSGKQDSSSSSSPSNSMSSVMSSAATPPPLPGEEQPALPEDGYLWTPGYWYWRDQAYFWMAGAWVRPPRVGVLWTPAYWSSAGHVFVFHPGYWGTTVGFYGGVNYGYGYSGSGYSGGHWIGTSFAYNSAVNHLNPAVAHHTYAASVPNQSSRGVVSYTGASRAGAATRTASRLASLPEAVSKPAPTTTVHQTTSQAPGSMALDRPAAVVKPSPASAPAKITHVTTARAAEPK